MRICLKGSQPDQRENDLDKQNMLFHIFYEDMLDNLESSADGG